jgi:hypothetical protein
MRTSGWLGVLAVAAALSIAGCGSTVVGASAPAAPGGTAASTPARSAANSSQPAPRP